MQKDKSLQAVGEKTIADVKSEKVWRLRWFYPISVSGPFAEELEKWLKGWKGCEIEQLLRQKTILKWNDMLNQNIPIAKIPCSRDENLNHQSSAGVPSDE